MNDRVFVDHGNNKYSEWDGPRLVRFWRKALPGVRVLAMADTPEWEGLISRSVPEFPINVEHPCG